METIMRLGTTEHNHIARLPLGRLPTASADALTSPKRNEMKSLRNHQSRHAINRLTYETLEPRIALSAAGLVEVGTQPTGSLTGKIVYLSPGHGYQYIGSNWTTDRGETHEMVEPFGTQDQMTYLANYLFQAGATIVPMRPIGRQLNEVVLDNDSPGVTFSGAWSNSTGTRYYDEDYGAVADAVSYRFANVSATETATAIYTPTIIEAGFYPVYTWVAHGTNRTNQLYEVNHSGGSTEVRVDHRQVGNGWVYLGTYHFDAGTSGSVVISNQSTAGGSVVIADAIRFGNGMGDLPDGPNGAGNPGGTLSGKPREDEAALLWVIRGIGQGINASTFFNVASTTTDPNITAPAKMAEHMNANTNAFGSSVYLAIHSNAFNGDARGAVSLVHSSSPTPNQSALATYIGQQINGDMQALDGTFDYNWSPRTPTLAGAYGEINAGNFRNSSNVVEMDATLAEVAFHDNAQDANIMRDPRGRDAIARAMYQALVQYFDVHGGLDSPISVATPPINVYASSNASGAVTVNWTAGPTIPASVNGAPATGFRVYASVDGYGFDGGTYVAGGSTTSVTLSGYDPTLPYYFKVVAVNAGGESNASEVMTVLPSGGDKQLLIVNGFDRNHLSQNFRYTTQLNFPGGANVTVDRVYQRYNNSFDYVIQTHEAIHAAKPGVHVDSTSNEAVISGAVNLSDYDTVIWILGEESTANDTFNATEQTKVQQFIASGGNLFLSGSEIGWDLDAQGGGVSFYEGTLKTNYIADDANTYNVVAAAGGIFTGLSGFSFSNGATFTGADGQLYNVDYPDVIAPLAGAQSALTYSGGTGGTAAIQVQGVDGNGSIVYLAFPFETITTAANRAAVMDRVLDFFGISTVVPNADFNGDGKVDGRDFLAWQRGFGTPAAQPADGDANSDGQVDGADLGVWQEQYAVPLAVQEVASLKSAELDNSPTPPAAEQLGIAQALTTAALSESNSEPSLDYEFTSFDESYSWSTFNIPTSCPPRRAAESGTQIDFIEGKTQRHLELEFDLAFTQMGTSID